MRRPRPWHLLLALSALIVPLQAGALGAGEGSAAMSVSATLDHCGVSDSGIVCKIDVSWSAIEDADSYTASVTGPGGAVTVMGTVGTGPAAGSASLWVPYAGDGVYSVMITAWGEEDENGNKPKLHEEQAESRLAPDAGREPRDPEPGNGEGQQPPEPPEQPEPAPEPKPEQPPEVVDPAPEQPEPAPAPEPVEPAPAPTPAPAPEPETPAAPPAEPAPETGAAPVEPAAPASSPQDAPASQT